MRDRVPSARAASAATAAVVLVLALLVVFAPEVVPAGVRDAAAALREAVAPWVVTLALSLVALLYALGRFRRTDAPSVDRLVDGDRTEDSTASGAGSRTAGEAAGAVADLDRPGRDFDRAVERVRVRLAEDPDAEAWEAQRVRHRLRAAVRTVRTGDADRSRGAVEAALVDGSWTDDRVAAAFLGGDDAPDVGLPRRLYAWLYPARAFERRVERTVDAIEAAAEGTGSARDGDAADGDESGGATGDGGGTRADVGGTREGRA